MAQHSVPLLSLAVLLLATSGVCIVVRQRRIAARLFFAGAAIAASSGLIHALLDSETGETLADALAWMSVICICAALLYPRRVFALALGMIGIVVAARVLGVPLHVFIDLVWRHPWLTLLIVAAPFLAMAATQAMPDALRTHLLKHGSARPFERFVLRWLNHFGDRRKARNSQQRTIYGTGTTRRARQGRGPHTI